jgi:hypothetical protein
MEKKPEGEDVLLSLSILLRFVAAEIESAANLVEQVCRNGYGCCFCSGFSAFAASGDFRSGLVAPSSGADGAGVMGEP